MLFVIYYFNLKPKTDLIETQKFLNAVVQKPSTHVIWVCEMFACFYFYTLLYIQ